MEKIKFSEFLVQSDTTTNSFLVGYEFSGDPNIDNINFRIKVEDILQILSDSGDGETLIKEGTGNELILKKIEGVGAIVLTPLDDKIRISVNNAQLNLANQSGIVPLSKGGTGANLSVPADNSFFVNVNGQSIFLKIGDGLVIDGGEIKVQLPQVLTTKGDLLSRNNSTEVRLPVGNDGQILEAESSTASGLRWVNKVVSDKTKAAASSVLDGYLNDLITTQGGITKSLVNSDNELRLGLDPSLIDLSLADNNNSQFISQSDIASLFYDSGWFTVPEYDSGTSVGITHLSNFSDLLSIRVINNLCFISGYLYIPLADGEGLPVTNFNTIPTLLSKSVATGASTGIQHVSGGGGVVGTFFPKILPNALSFGKEARFSTFKISRNFPTVNSSGTIQLAGGGKPIGFRVEFSPRSVIIESDTRIRISSSRDLENPAGSAPIVSIPSGPIYFWERNNIPVFDALDKISNFQDYRTSHTAANADRAVRTSFDSDTYRYPFDFDGNNPADLGGCLLYIEAVLPLNESLDRDTIVNEIEAYKQL